MHLSFRIAQPQDAEALAALVNSAYRGDSSKQGWTHEADLLGGQRTDAQALRDQIAQSGQVILMLMSDDKLMGSVFLQNKTDRGYLGMLTIDPTQQTGGLGKQPFIKPIAPPTRNVDISHFFKPFLTKFPLPAFRLKKAGAKVFFSRYILASRVQGALRGEGQMGQRPRLELQ